MGIGRHTPSSVKANSSVTASVKHSLPSNMLRKTPIKSSRYTAAPLFVSKALDNRPYISVTILGHEVIGLLDSGATSTIIGEGGKKYLECFKLKINPAFHKHISTADGVQQLVSGQVDLPISISNTFQIVKALVVPSLPQPFIFGSDFASQFGLSIDYKNNSWHIQSTGSNETIQCYDSFVEYNSFQNLWSLSDLSSEQKNLADAVIASFNEISNENKLGRTDKIVMSIDTGDAKPFKKRPYLMSPYMMNILNSELDEMLRLGVVESSNSPWCSPVLLVKKKDGSYRFCFDGRPLNELTKHDSYPLPHIDRILNMLRDAKYISSLDLRKAFWQIPLDSASKEKTAFSVVGRGLFQFTTVPFGLCNAAQTQQRLVDAIFGPKFEPKIFTYLDDIIICSTTFEEHLSLLAEVKNRLKEANLTINLKKCDFFKTSLKFLGYIVGNNSLSTDPDKVSTMVNYPRPTTVTEVKRFVGLCSWYRRFLKDFSTLVAPITALMKGSKKNDKIPWSDEAEEAFLKIKQALVSAPILSQPDFSKEFTIQCDASNVGLGGVLTQVLEGEERVIAYASRTLSRAEKNYGVTEKELLALLFCIEKFRPYIEGVRFKCITDHYSLLWLNNLKNPTGKLARWAVKLRQHNFELIHRKGSSNVVPDALSRIPIQESVNVLFTTWSATDSFYDNLKSKILASPDSFPQWKVENNLIYKFIPFSSPVRTNVQEWKLLVPKKHRKEVVGTLHDPPTSAHLGFYKTLARVSEYYYWPKMRSDILKYVRSCKMCGSQKVSSSGRFGLMGSEKEVRFPWQIIAADIMGPFPRSSRGNRYLLVVSDWLTKYTLLHPMKEATAHSVAKFVENDVFLVFGVPQFIIVDNGTQFAGSIFKSLAKTYEVQKIWYNARYSPQCNFVERCNRTIGQAIRSYVDKHKDWDKELKKIQHALNTAKHEVTSYTPSFLNFGRHVPLSGKFYGSVPSTVDLEITPGDRNHYASELNHLTDVFEDVRRRLHVSYKRNANTYNLRKKEISFNIGEKVWRRNKILSDASKNFTAKLAPKFVLCTIGRRISKLAYHLVNADGSDAGVWHVKDLKPYLGSNSDVSVG